MPLSDEYFKWQRFCKSFSNDIELIFSGLLKLLKLSGISFYRIYKNEERIFMSNSVKWIENYFDNNYFATQSYNNHFNLRPYNLWITWPKDDIGTHALIKDAFNNFDYGNSLYIIRLGIDYVDVFVLRGFARDYDLNNRYFVHLDTINVYIDYFLLIYSKEIVKAENNKIIPELSKTVTCTDISEESSSNPNYTTKSIINTVLHPDTGTPFLSKRETECLQHLIRGRTNKEIARKLGLSHRTIEEYIKNIKHKMGIESKSEIIEKILSFNPNKKVLIN